MPAGSSRPATTPDPVPNAIRIPRDLEIAAASRLVGETPGARSLGGRRMLSAATLQGIDTTLMWGVVDRRGSEGRPFRVRQVCLAVPGSGHTAMLVVSPPGGRQESEADHADRIAAIHAACEGLAELNRAGRFDIRLVQALPEPRDSWTVRAFLDAGFLNVGHLAYMRAPLRPARGKEPPPAANAAALALPTGVTIRNVAAVGPGQEDREAVIAALNRSYIDTLDCPELCGLRRTEDILDSHRATGAFSSDLWWLVLLGGQPHGCLLMSHIPDHSCVELVYLGLSPELRGKGIGCRLLEMGMARAASRSADHMACAVDLRNTPARKVYERVGFREFGQRIALVKPLPTNDAAARTV